jgi:hypothetical protein
MEWRRGYKENLEALLRWRTLRWPNAASATENRGKYLDVNDQGTSLKRLVQT